MSAPTLRIATGVGVAQRWLDAYYSKEQGRWHPHAAHGEAEELFAKLKALGPSPSVADVVAVIGNESWTHSRCDLCGDKKERVAIYTPEFGSSNFFFTACEECLCAGLAAFPST